MPDSMKTHARIEFDEWYDAHEHDKFDFQKEIEFYCELDVDILMRGCLKFREILLNVGLLVFNFFVLCPYISGPQRRSVHVCCNYSQYVYADLSTSISETGDYRYCT